MNKFFLSAALVASLSAQAYAASSFTNLDSPVGRASFNGRYAVGYNPSLNDHNFYLESYIFDSLTGETSWMTQWNEDDYSLAGQFSGVSDNGTICGVTYDMDNFMTWVDEFFGEEFSGYTQIATIWENGVRTPLPIGEVDKTEFTQLEDGTFAQWISADGNTVAGFVTYGNMGTVKPCYWTRDEAGEWSFKFLPLPENAGTPVVTGISADGKKIIGGAYFESGNKILVWDEGEVSVLGGPETPSSDGWVSIQSLGISANGRFAILSYNMKGMIYDFQTQEYRSIVPFDDNSNITQYAVVDNNGNVFGNYAGYPYNRPFVYSYEDDRILDLGYYLSVVASEISESAIFGPGSQATFNSISADGRCIAGNTGIMYGRGWFMQLDSKEVVFPDMPEISYAFSRNLNEVTLRWSADKKHYDDFSLTGYNLYCNGTLIQEIPAESDSFEITLDNQSAGYPEFTIESVFAYGDGGEIVSPKSNPVSVAVAPDYALPFMDDFEMQIQSHYWTTSIDYGNVYDCGWSSFMGAGVGDGSGLYSSVSSKTPYSFNIISRPMDATDESYVSLSFGFIYALLNEENQILDKDYVSIDYSTDKGDTWTEAGIWSIADMSAGNWCFKTIDLSDKVAGKVFSLRIRRHGEGVAMYMSAIDNFSVNISKDLLEPTGLTGVRPDDSTALLIWKSPSECYNLNHIGNLRTMNMAFGNDGEEIIAANLFTSDDLAPYAGKYITSVSALVNYFNWYDDVLGINATAVIFEDGEIVREQEFEEIVYNGYSVANLDEPLLIDSSKELRVGVRIHDYDDWQWPVAAAVADDYIPGKTDLYSYDEGKTWENISDLYDPLDIQGHCIWDITAHVTDTAEAAEVDFFDMPLFYNVFRDGELLNTIAIDGNATRCKDSAAYDNASYRVGAYAANGEISELSEAFVLVSTGVVSVAGENSGLMFDGSIVTANEDALRLTVFTTEGCALATSEGNTVSVENLPAGIYIVGVEFADRMESAKLMIRK